MVDFGGSSSSGSSNFSRYGDRTQRKRYSALPATVTSNVNDAFGSDLKVNPSLASAERTSLASMLGKASSAVPGQNFLTQLMQLTPGSFTGNQSLLNIAQRNPYSSDYENATQDLFNRIFAQGRALMQSGPANVRGATGRQGQELGEYGAQQAMNRFREVRGQQNAEAGIVTNAVSLANAIEQMRRSSMLKGQEQQVGTEQAYGGISGAASNVLARQRATQLAALQMASELFGVPEMKEYDNLTGQGFQQNDSFQWGLNLLGGCCFIFLECLNGQLPWYVRLAREHYSTPARRDGYRWMSSWLVSVMRRLPRARKLVNNLLVRPFLTVGSHLYVKRSWKGTVLYPYIMLWMLVWSFLGTFGLKGYKEYGPVR